LREEYPDYRGNRFGETPNHGNITCPDNPDIHPTRLNLNIAEPTDDETAMNKNTDTTRISDFNIWARRTEYRGQIDRQYDSQEANVDG